MDNVDGITSASTAEDGAAAPSLPVPVAEDAVNERKKSILVLILRHLHDHGFGQSYHTLCMEAGLSLHQIDVADNIDLSTVVQAYEEYYESKFGRKPRLSRGIGGDVQIGSVQGTSGTFHPGTVGPFFSAPLPPLYPHGATVLSPTAQNDGYTGLGSTCRVGSTIPVTQEELIQTVGQLPDLDPSHAFTFDRPRRNAGTKRSVHLFLSEIQEKILYALVGCGGIGWNIRAITPESREFLAARCNINKEMLQLFFKNRSKRPKRDRSRKKDVPQPQGLNGGFNALVHQAASPLTHQGQVAFAAQQQPGPAHHHAPQMRQLGIPQPLGAQLAASPSHQNPTLPAAGAGTPSVPGEVAHHQVEPHSVSASLHTPVHLNVGQGELGTEVTPIQAQLPSPLLSMQAHSLGSNLMMQHLIGANSLGELVTQGMSVDAVSVATAAVQHPQGAPQMVNATAEGM